MQRLDEETGEVTVRLRGKIIVKVAKSGLITLNADGMRTVSPTASVLCETEPQSTP